MVNHTILITLIFIIIYLPELRRVPSLIREFKKRLQRRRGHRRLKNELIFYLRISQYSFSRLVCFSLLKLFRN